LLGKTWIEKDQMRRKEKEEATQKKNQELRNFIARKIDRLIEEQEVESKKQKARELVVKVERMQEGLKDLPMQEESISI
jgi:NAD-dependent DNA ligase